MDIFINQLMNRAKLNCRSIVFPEGESLEIVQAAHRAQTLGICKPILLGNAEKIRAVCGNAGIALHGWYETVDPSEADMEKDVLGLCEGIGLDPVTVRFLLEQPLYYATMMLRNGKADAMVAGFISETTEVISAGRLIVGLAEGISSPSSFFIMDIPGFIGSEGSMLVYADAGANVDPTAEELADIAIQTARNAFVLLGWEPRVALLSFSTKGSASHEKVDKVLEALRIVRIKAPNMLIDGEMQVDAALLSSVAEKKVPGGSLVAGQANILIFPDLNAGNIAYKLTQRLTGGRAYGPILQGFCHPICDLSRGSTVDDILGIICVAAVE